MKITDSIWFTPLASIGQIGIVIGEDETTGQRKAYIGVGHGVSDERDEQLVAQYGSKFPAVLARRISTWLNEEPSPYEVANRIVDELFTNPAGQEASRLVLELIDGRDGGGWVKQSIRDLIAKHLMEKK